MIGYASVFMLPLDGGGAFNWSDFDDEVVIGHLKAARSASDPETAAGEFVAAQEIFAPLQLQVKLANAYHLTYLSDGLTGVTTSVSVYSSPWALHLGGA